MASNAALLAAFAVLVVAAIPSWGQRRRQRQHARTALRRATHHAAALSSAGVRAAAPAARRQIAWRTASRLPWCSAGMAAEAPCESRDYESGCKSSSGCCPSPQECQDRKKSIIQQCTASCTTSCNKFCVKGA
ncbi:hypothetical protein BRADI_4g09671v3 [Brachypodium distachyon]|uniref:Uncharacterized protein n=1 Tax=Brachypodium distachyon TaxID=15368 RepID=I1IJ88_BRADI|nr:hypothetical protein BRADI_4g09671v3 [Brachypodium distachyon]